MSRDGSGNFTLVSGNPVVTGTVIASTWANATLSDIAAALTQSLSKDGQTTPTANLTMGNFRLTSLAAAIARTDAPNAGQIQDGGLLALGSVSGTDTITASSSPAITVYTAGQTFDFIAAGTNLTGVVTLNINSLGAKAITKYGAQGIMAGDIVSGQSVRVRYDGTQFQMISAPSAVPTVVGSTRNAVMSVTAASASATFTADEVVVRTALGGPAFVLPSFSKTINLATTGAGGMDTGAAPVSGYVALYAIYNPTTGTAALLAKNATSAVQPNVYGGANMPAGYTASTLVSVWPTNGSSQFIVGYQADRAVSFPPVVVISTSSPVAGVVSVGISSTVPPNAKACGGTITISSTSSTSGADTIVYGSSTQIGQQTISVSQPSGTTTGATAPFSGLPIITQQTIYWAAFVNNGTFVSANINISSYSF